MCMATGQEAQRPHLAHLLAIATAAVALLFDVHLHRGEGGDRRGKGSVS